LAAGAAAGFAGCAGAAGLAIGDIIPKVVLAPTGEDSAAGGSSFFGAGAALSLFPHAKHMVALAGIGVLQLGHGCIVALLLSYDRVPKRRCDVKQTQAKPNIVMIFLSGYFW
jgi:hypothetical protein